MAISVWGDPTTLNISDASVTVTSSSSTTLNFPISRGGDTSYDAFVQYQTQDGSAVAGTDYTAAMGSLVIPAGATSAIIPVTIAGSNNSQPDKTFQMLLLGGGGAARTFTPSFDTQQTFGTGAAPDGVTAADLNGDGLPDLIAANFNGNTVSVLLNTTASGAAIPSFATQHTFTTGRGPASVTVADVNGDGKPDLIVANLNSNTVSVLLNTTAPGAATPSFATQKTFAVGGGPLAVAAADLNGDGKADLIVANGNDNTVSVLLNTTAPGAATPSFAAQKTFAVGSGPIAVATADLNGDGKSDLIVANGNDNTVSVLLDTTAPGATTPSFATQQTFAVGFLPQSVTAADLNGDGKPDLIVANEGGNTVSVLLNVTAPGSATASFASQQAFGTGTEPIAVVAADVNGDGKPDLIVANLNDDTASVLLNTTAPGAATPSFATQQIFATGTEPFSVVATSVNSDGKSDLVFANLGDDTVSVLLNTSPAPATTFDSNSFATQQSFAVGNNPLSQTTADLNGDGQSDLIVTNENDNTVSVLRNTTAPGAVAPSFATQQTFATGNEPHSVTTADINGDGKPDLVVANYNDNTVSVMLNTTAPGATTLTFATQQTFGVGSGPYSVMTADVNGDGRPDLVVTNFNGDTVSVLLNTTAPGAATPSFATQQTFTTGLEPASVTASDINGDGRPDLIVANFNSNTVSVLLNTTAPGAATPSFATQQTFATGVEPVSVRASDVNLDGRPDLIVANEGDHTVSVLLNTTAPGAVTPSFATQQTFDTGIGPASVTTADIDCDGKLDLIVANMSDNTVSVLLNTTAPGAAVASFDPQQAFATGSGPVAAAALDLNGDGKADLIVANSANTVSVLLNALYATTLSGSPATGTIHYGAPTATPTFTATPTATATATVTATDTPTATSTATATDTATSTATVTATATPTATDTATSTATATATDTATSTATETATATATPTATATATSTATATDTPTATATTTATATATPTPTATATDTATSTSTATATATDTATATATATATVTATATSTATATATPTATATATATATPTTTATPTATATATATATPTATATATASATATATATETATATATSTPTATPTPTAPTSKSQCYNGGWTQWEGPPLNFNNQGNCISWVNSHPSGAARTGAAKK
jgi:hypothetical protein